MHIKNYKNFGEPKNQIGNFNNFKKLFEYGEISDKLRKNIEFIKKNFIDSRNPHPVFDSIRLKRIFNSTRGEFYTKLFYKNTLEENSKIKLERLGFFTDLEEKLIHIKKNFREENIKGVEHYLYILKNFLDSHAHLLIFDDKKIKEYIYKERDDDPYKKYQLFGNMHELILDIFKKRGM